MGRTTLTMLILLMLSALLALNAASEQPQNAAYPVESYADISMEGKYAQMAEKYDALQQQVGGLTKELEEMKQELSTTQGENDSTYFRVTMTRRVSVSAGSNVMFDTIDVNVGGWYSIHSGTYLCLVPGLYMFNVHIMLDDTLAGFDLKKNSEVLARLHVNSGRGWQGIQPVFQYGVTMEMKCILWDHLVWLVNGMKTVV